jgi:hypothetical protein
VTCDRNAKKNCCRWYNEDGASIFSFCGNSGNGRCADGASRETAAAGSRFDVTTLVFFSFSYS